MMGALVTNGHLEFLNGLCILIVLLCSSMSAVSACNIDEFQCTDFQGTCLNMMMRCNYYKDCADNSDEINCSFPIVDMSVFLMWLTIYQQSTVSYSMLLKQFGNPYDYALQLNNASYREEHQLGMHMEWAIVSNNMIDTAKSFDIDYRSQTVYYTSGDTDRISFINLNNYDNTVPISRHYTVVPVSKQITGISLNWASSVLYWSDAAYGLIGALNLYRNVFWKPIISTDLISPQDVVVSPENWYLFWIDGGSSQSNPKIERSDLSGSDASRTLIVSLRLVTPFKLCLDKTSSRLYWLDPGASSLSSVDVNGDDRDERQLEIFSQIVSFALYKDYIFLGHKDQPFVMIMNQTGPILSILAPPYTGFKGVTDVVMIEPSFQQSTSPCVAESCGHFCFETSPSSTVCSCALGFVLDTDQVSCITQPYTSGRYILMSDLQQFNIYQIRPDTGEVRAILNPLSAVINTTALALDPVKQDLYVIPALENSAIFKMSLNPIANKTENLVLLYQAKKEEIVSELAVDYRRGLLYFTDVGPAGAVYEISTNGNGKPRTIIAETDSQLKTIVVDSNKRFLYWTSCNDAFGTISRIQLRDGGEQTELISELGMCATTLAVDFINDVMYWGDCSNYDGAVLVMIRLDGTGRKQVLKETSAFYFSLALSEKYLYISDSKKRSIRRLDRKTLVVSDQTPYYFTMPGSIEFYDEHAPTPATLPIEDITQMLPTSSLNGNGQQTGPFSGGVIIGVAVAAGGFLCLVAVSVVVVAVCWIRKRNLHLAPAPLELNRGGDDTALQVDDAEGDEIDEAAVAETRDNNRDDEPLILA